MSTYWLRNELAKQSDAVIDGGDPILIIKLNNGNAAVYCPDPGEYIVCSDVIDKVISLGGNFVAYSNTWCKASYEAKQYGRLKGVDVLPFGEFFSLLRKRGVRFT